LALLAGPALAAGPFDGTWKAQLDTMKFTGKPDVYEIQGGMYKCASCTPPYTVKADGSDQAVSGHSYYDSVAVKVVDAHTVRFDNKLKGKLMSSDTASVSADGGTLTDVFKDYSGAKEVTGTQTSKRVAAGPAGAHALSGSWQVQAIPDLTDNGMTVVYKMTGDGLQMSMNGQSYDARFDGKKYPVANDPGKTLVALKRVSDTVIEETDTRDGKVTDITRLSVSADGKTLTVVDNDQLRGTTMEFKMLRQP